ncbi:hypothetical protein [Streptomyces sp. SID3343]|uniref:hypothetical protein n=1 Tax=Streptomyces sp. SID3343 TaxID=2690260 RepID=UPI00136CBCB7|nr:hypothetical protein [Streptomyces sp. SID3343]MYW00270.1 hypothetical protein [Streptomyces sp. SID3343]
MDLSEYNGYFLDRVRLETEPGGGTASVRLVRGEADSVVLELSHVVHARMDGTGDWDEFVDEITVRDLPRTGPWPTWARHLLHHHNNETTMVWVKLIGPTEIEILARSLTIH